MTIKRKISLTLAAVTTLLATITYVVILPVINEITTVVRAIHNEREDLEAKYQRGQQIRRITAEFKKIQQDLGRLNALYLPAGRELNFITTLETIARTYQLELDKTTDLATAFPSPDTPLPLTLTLRGSFTQITRYLLELERQDIYFNIGHLSIRGRVPQTGEVTAVIAGQAYRRAYEPNGETRRTTETEAEIPPPSSDNSSPTL